MSTTLANIVLGSTVFTKGIAFDAGDLAVNASKKSQSASTTGKGKHFGVIIGKDATGIVVVGSATLGGANNLVGTVKQASLPYWIPVKPAAKEAGMSHEPVTRGSGDETKPKWINVRKTHNIQGAEFNVSVAESYSLDTVNIIRKAVGLPEVTA